MIQNEGAKLLQSFSDAVVQLAEAVSPSVVNVSNGRRTGTGMVWSPDGHIITAGHVVGRGVAPTVTLSDGREFQSEVVGVDRFSDVAVLKIDASGLTAVSRGDAGELRVGQFVLALANAFGRKPSATSGIVTSRMRNVRGWWGTMVENAVVSDAKLNPGYSGGPLVDAWGNLRGMNVAYFSGRGVAVPVDQLTEVVPRLVKDRGVKKGYLGVVVEPIELPDDISGKAEVGQDTGLLVRSVEVETPAKRAGLTVGDIIVRLGGTKVSDDYELHRALASDSIGKEQSLWVLRGGALAELKVTPVEGRE